jgi:putative peptide zinc metalloprotease protein
MERAPVAEAKRFDPEPGDAADLRADQGAPELGPPAPGDQGESTPGPLMSEDGHWWWDGAEWQPVAPPPAQVTPPAVESPEGDPEPFRAETFLRRHSATSPVGGARRFLYQLSHGAINLGPSARDQHEQALMGLARTPVKDPPMRLAFVSSKGGVGKTTTCLMTASQLGLLRHDRIISLEANPHHGTFRSRVRMYHNRSVQDLLAYLDDLSHDDDISYPMLHRFVTQADDTRLEVLAIPLDAGISHALGEGEYRRVLRILYRFYDVLALDLGTGLLEPSTAYMLRVCDQAIVISPAALDGGKLADYTLDYLEARRGKEWLKERAMIVINGVRRDTLLEVSAMERHFRKRVRSTHRIRWDRHLEAGGVFEWPQVSTGARDDYLEVAAAVGGGFSLGPSPDSLMEDGRC